MIKYIEKIYLYKDWENIDELISGGEKVLKV